jgi:NAD-dependent deacetylase
MSDDQDRPKLVVLSGAGLSADSGIPTFRGSDGLWEDHSIDVVANGYTWRQNWDVVRRFYNDRRSRLATVSPNAAHETIARWQGKFRTVVLTQNIDDLLERAGCSDVVHLHGSLTRLRCVACGNTWDTGYCEHGEGLRCPVARCGSLRGVRPDVVFFNEMAPNYGIMHKALRDLRRQDLLVVIGTSGHVLDINSLVFDHPCTKILNNLEPNSIINDAYFDHAFYGPAAKMCREIDRMVEAHMIRHDPAYGIYKEMRDGRDQD